MYVVAVLFELDPVRADVFRAAIMENAETSMREEAGCHRFDVSFAPDGLKCFLYELYTDRGAFDEHLRSPHFISFDARSRVMVLGKRVEAYELAFAEANPA